MKSLRQTTSLLGLVSVGAFVLFASACGGDDTDVTPGAGGQGGATGSNVGGSGGQAGKAGAATGGGGGNGGASTGSAGAGTSGAAGAGTGGGATGGAGAGGAGTAGSGNTDGGLSDASDSGNDVSQDSSSGGDARAEAEASTPLTIDQFQHAISVAWCDRIAECCQLNAAHFDRDKCLAASDNGAGPERVSGYLRQYMGDAGGVPSTIIFSAAQAEQCVQLQRTRSCSSVSGDEKLNLYATCVTALQGTLTAGRTGCKTSVECTGGLYCQPSSDGGPSSCVALSGAAQACSDPNQNSDECTYLGVRSATSTHCSVFGGTGTCVAGLGLAATCKNDQECASGVCSTISGTCVNSQPAYPSSATCTFLTKPDGG